MGVAVVRRHIGGAEWGSTEPAGAVRSTRAWIAAALAHSGMPPKEIRSVLATHDPELVRRHMELHRERLVEQLDDQLQELTRLQQLIEPLCSVQMHEGGPKASFAPATRRGESGPRRS